MADAVYELSDRIVYALRQDAGIQAIFGNPPRIKSEPDAATLFPYISYAASQDLPRFAEDFDLSKIFVSYDVWGDKGQVKLVSNGMAAIRNVCHLVKPFDTANFSVTLLVHETSHGPFRDQDEIRWHGQITFRAGMEARGF
jgi:hypothetical protein